MDYDEIDIDELPRLDEKEYPTDKRFEFVVFQAAKLFAKRGDAEIENEAALKVLIKFAVQVLKFYKWWWKN